MYMSCIYNYIIYIYINKYICNHKNSVPSWLSPQWLCSNSCNWAYDVRFQVPNCMSCHKVIVVIAIYLFISLYIY